jgi:cell division protein FtsA
MQGAVMGKVFSGRIVTAIDVGTTKICVLVASQVDKDHLEVIGVGKAPSDGLKKGVVVDVAKTIESIKQAVKEAELMSGHIIDSAYIGISGGHIKSINSHGAVPIKTGQVRTVDIDNVLAAARAVQIAPGQQILHVLPQYFQIDGGDRLTDPTDMYGIRLEVQAHIITGSVASAQNLVNCCENAGVKVTDIVLEQLASAQAVLSPDEQELGVGMLDVGGGTSDLALYRNGSIRHTMVLPVAGNHFTNDLAVGLRTTINDAERIKRRYGLVDYRFLDQDEEIEIEMVQGKHTRIIHRFDLLPILEPRARELLSLVHDEIVNNRLRSLIASGLVLTGGGSLLLGMKELAQEIFDCDVRIGSPRLQFGISESLDNPVYATGYGLLLHALKSSNDGLHDASGPGVKKLFSRMKSWVADFF